MSASTEAMRLRDIVRSKDPMHELCQNRLITPEACDWVKSALDPFHDQQLEHVRGYPDVSTDPTVVVKVRQALTVSAPPGLQADQTWDCHIVTSPIDFNPMSASSLVAADAHAFGRPETGTPGSALSLLNAAGTIQTFDLDQERFYTRTGRMDGLLINSVPADSIEDRNWTYTPLHCPEEGGGGYQLQQINLDNYLDFQTSDFGVYRLIYSGFEVVNTTAQIYKQGAVTVYEYGNSFETAASSPVVGNAPDVSNTSSYINGYPYIPPKNPTSWFRCPPNTIAEAKIMPGSHSWAAADGCYCTAKFQTDNPFQGMTQRPFCIAQNEPTAGPNSGYYQTGSNTPSGGSYASDYTLGYDRLLAGNTPPSAFGGPVHFSRMNTTGAYFTGLSPQTTLFVTWRVGIERLPAANKPTFLALAQPSAPFDPPALVLYSMVANVLPPGCPQGYNDAGKWFKWISDAAQKSIPTVYPIVRTATMLAGAMGRPILASALGGLSQAMKPVAEQQAAQRLQAAARRKQSAKGSGRKAVQNWSQPTPRGVRPGGVNGLK